jgi:hypothetical protein
MKLFFLFFQFIFLFLLLTSAVESIGLAPGKAYLDYEEGETVTFELRVIGSTGSSKVQMYTQGWLADYVSLSEMEFVFDPDKKLYPITVTIDMPPYEDITEYGLQRFFIGARDIVESAGGISASAAVKMWVEMDIPFPGKYARINELVVHHILEGEVTPVSATIANRGTNPLSDARVYFSLSNLAGDVLAEKEFTNVFIPVDTEQVFEHEFLTETFDSGIYEVTVRFFYDDGSSIQKSTTYFIGTTDILLTEYTPRLETGTINKINLTLQSIWGSPLNNVRLAIRTDEKTSSLPSIDLAAFEKLTIEAFIEVPATESPSLNASLDLVIPITAEESMQKSIPLTFELYSASRKEFPVKLNMTSTLFLIVGILLLLLVINIFFFTKRNSLKQDTKKSTSASLKKK